MPAEIGCIGYYRAEHEKFERGGNSTRRGRADLTPASAIGQFEEGAIGTDEGVVNIVDEEGAINISEEGAIGGRRVEGT